MTRTLLPSISLSVWQLASSCLSEIKSWSLVPSSLTNLVLFATECTDCEFSVKALPYKISILTSYIIITIDLHSMDDSPRSQSSLTVQKSTIFSTKLTPMDAPALLDNHFDVRYLVTFIFFCISRPLRPPWSISLPNTNLHSALPHSLVLVMRAYTLCQNSVFISL